MKIRVKGDGSSLFMRGEGYRERLVLECLFNDVIPFTMASPFIKFKLYMDI